MQMTPVSHLRRCRCGCSSPCGSQTWWARAAHVSTCSPPTSNLRSDVSAEDAASHFMDTLFRQRVWLCAHSRSFLGHDLCFYCLPGAHNCLAVALVFSFLLVCFLPNIWNVHQSNDFIWCKVFCFFVHGCKQTANYTVFSRSLYFLVSLIRQRCSTEFFRGLIAIVNYAIPKLYHALLPKRAVKYSVRISFHPITSPSNVSLPFPLSKFMPGDSMMTFAHI